MATAAPPSETSAPTTPGLGSHLDRVLTKPMFFLTLAFLLVTAGVLHRIGEGFFTFLELGIIVWSLLILWPIFVAESILRFIVSAGQMGFWPRWWHMVLVCLFPPARLGARSYSDVGKMWLPRLGFVAVDRALVRKLETFFSVPMMGIALLVLPVLAMEYFWEEQVQAHFGWKLALDIASSVIWMAFAIEFTLMVSTAKNKARYCWQNWMDLTIVVLPVLDFLPILRLFRLTRILELQQLSRMGRLYRLRGLLVKLWRAVLLLDILQRLMGNRDEKRLSRLRELLAARTEELEELKQDIDELEKTIARKKEAKP
ncbi:MAG: hypothetical protein L0215_19400 [Gemmataceae bacterium]|nr:hypothetical protein [Gemmataceae bacterium]